MEILRLSKNIRAKEYWEFGEFFLRVGIGTKPTKPNNLILLSEEMVVKYESEKTLEDALIDVVFTKLNKNSILA